MSLPLVSIRRYPVKAMGGEYPTDAALDERGIVGDRWFAVHDADGFLATGKNGRRFRRHDEVFDHGAITEDGVVWVHCEDGRWPVGAPELDAHLSDCMGLPVSIQPETATLHQDLGYGESPVRLNPDILPDPAITRFIRRNNRPSLYRRIINRWKFGVW